MYLASFQQLDFSNDLGLKDDNFHFIIDQIIRGSFFSKKHKFQRELSANFLKKYVGNDYKKHLVFLSKEINFMGLPVIYTNGHYKNGSQAIIYTLNEKLVNSKIVFIKVKHRALYRKLINSNYYQTHSEIEQFIFDFASAKNHIINSEVDAPKMNQQLFLIHSLEYKQYWYKKDLTAGRLHHPFTNLKKELRQFISYDGKYLVEIDLCNSQPLIFACIIESCFKKTENRIASFEGIQQINKIVSEEKLLSESTNNFIQACKEGKIYERIEAEYNLHFTLKKTNRDLVKKSFMLLFFDKIRENNFSHCFETNYPQLFGILNKIKAQLSAEINLAICLQKVESIIFIEDIKPKLEKLKIPHFTVHDCFFTTEEHTLTIKKIAEDAFKRYFNSNAVFRIKPLKKPVS